MTSGDPPQEDGGGGAGEAGPAPRDPLCSGLSWVLIVVNKESPQRAQAQVRGFVPETWGEGLSQRRTPALQSRDRAWQGRAECHQSPGGGGRGVHPEPEAFRAPSVYQGLRPRGGCVPDSFVKT